MILLVNALVGVLLLAATAAEPGSASAPARRLHRLEIAGGVQLLSLDRPVKNGRVYLFHRYPDGVYLSVPIADVLGIASTTVEEKPKSEAKTVYLGPTGEGIRTEAAERANAEPPSASYDAGYYYDWCYGCYSPPRPPPRPGPVPPSLVGPNGFPLTPGSPAPLPIGPNGYPILSPPPAASPR